MFIPLVCVLLLGGMLAEFAEAGADTPSDSQTIPSNGSESKYYFETVFLGNYYQAIQFCNHHGLTLLSIESAEENAYLYQSLQSFLGDGGYTFWTSGTRLPQDHWVWLSTGNPIVYSPWTTQPMNANKCLDVGYSKNKNSLVWTASNCSLGRHTICETPSSSATSLVSVYYHSNLTLLN